MKQFQNNWENYLEIVEIPENMAVGAVSYALETAIGDRGNKVFELSNHLGNVLATVSDKKLGRVLDSTSFVAAYYEGQVRSAQDYYAFGWGIPSRSFSAENYRYGYQGSEKNVEINNGSYTTEFRQLDTRVGKWLSKDPIASNYPSLSPYNSMGNNPIVITDVQGDSIPTTFLGRNGKELKKIPKQVQRMFNKEYGIQVGYNAETKMLYKSGDVETDQEIAEDAKAILESRLGEENSSVSQVFGYNLHLSGTAINGGRHFPEAMGDVTTMDLADFDKDLNAKGLSRVTTVSQSLRQGGRVNLDFDRTYNMARVYEHEFIAHGIENRIDGDHRASAHNRINRLSRRPLGLPTLDDFRAKQSVIYRGKMYKYRPSIFRPEWQGSTHRRGDGPFWNAKSGQFMIFSDGTNLWKGGPVYERILLRKRTAIRLNF